ncbi:MAG: hypothetical protein KA586_06070 [Candidatus Promineofilum sp.]|nr:hypothetical protein [Promineifilum sp.]
MRPEELDFILSPAGRALIAETVADSLSPAARLATASHLRDRVAPSLAAAVLEIALLRQRATPKFSRASQMYFTRDGLEQATAEPVADHRARRYAAAGFGRLADMGCGIGGDALALAAAGAEVIAIDRDWTSLVMARENAAVYDMTSRVWPVLADLTELPPPAVDAFFFDPARRTETGPRLAPGRRLRSVDNYRPPLSLIDAWRLVIPHGAVKVSPGIDYDEIPPDTEAEFVSLAGEVKETVLWYGDLRLGVARRATLLPSGTSLTDRDDETIEVGPPRAFLYEPDGAVIRAHLVGQLAYLIEATLLDPAIAYLTTAAPLATPFARGYAIEDHFPFQLKRLRTYLRARDVGSVTIKKRGSPLDPDVLRQALRLRGSTHRIVFLTQVGGRPTVLVGQALA